MNPSSHQPASITGIAIRYRCGEKSLAGWAVKWAIDPEQPEQPPLLVCSLICRHCGMQHTFNIQER